MKKRKLMGLVLAAILAGNIAGCGNAAPQNNAGTNEASDESEAVTSETSDAGSEEPVEIEIMITTYGTNLPDNDFVAQKILEETGVKVKLSLFASGDDTKTNLNLRLVGGTAPDIFQISSGDLQELASQGHLLALDEYEDKMPHVKEILDEIGAIGQVDGTQYAIPKKPGIFQDGYWIRKDWLDKFNLPMPTTLDELFTTVKTIKEGDPDGNGKDDTIGITAAKWGCISPILAAYGGATPTDLIEKDGEVISPLYDPMYREALSKIKELIQEGLIDSEFMALTSQLYTDKLTQGLPVVVYDYWTVFNKPELWEPIAEVNPEADWVMIPDLEGPGATVSDVFDPTNTGTLFGISSQLEGNDEKLDAIWKLYDYVSHGDGLKLVSYGLEGEHYNIEGDEIVATDKMATEANFTWLYQLTGRDEMEYLSTKFPYAKEDINFAVTRSYIRSVKSLVIYPEWYQKADAERFIEEEVTKFIFGERSLEEYDAFLETLNSTYRYEEFVSGVNEYVQGLDILD